MDANESAALIERAGGTKAFAELLGINTGEGWLQRVSNWRTRGIPSAVILEHYDTIQKLRSEKKRKPN
jgi:hypothetical protein